jgi:hypothetical protein
VSAFAHRDESRVNFHLFSVACLGISYNSSRLGNLEASYWPQKKLLPE